LKIAKQITFKPSRLCTGNQYQFIDDSKMGLEAIL